MITSAINHSSAIMQKKWLDTTRVQLLKQPLSCQWSVKTMRENVNNFLFSVMKNSLVACRRAKWFNELHIAGTRLITSTLFRLCGLSFAPMIGNMLIVTVYSAKRTSWLFYIESYRLEMVCLNAILSKVWTMPIAGNGKKLSRGERRKNA